MTHTLEARLKAAQVPDALIEAVRESGYYLRGWISRTEIPNITVSDPFYGNKSFSGSFPVDDFIAHLHGGHTFEPAPAFRREEVRSVAEIEEILRVEPRGRYLREGSLTFRGQPKEHYVQRRIPNPRRSDAQGRELSIMPGIYRQPPGAYSLLIEPREQRSFRSFAWAFEPEDDIAVGIDFSYDLMRTEQHYATQTVGLDLAFDLPTALFFATHGFAWGEDGRAFYRPVPRGEHQGVIYLFRFGSPSVRKTEYLIRGFDFFRTHRPERILRQHCGLPLFDPHERNIAVTEIDCIISLHQDFETDRCPSPEYMFPGVAEDPFYRKLLELKRDWPELLNNVVEYRWR